MELTVSEIASQVKGRVHGDGGAVIRGAAGLDQATPADISFLRDAKNTKAVESLRKSRAGAVFVPKGFTAENGTAIEVDNPIAAFSHVLTVIERESQDGRKGIDPSARIDASANVGKNVRIGPNCVVEAYAVIEDDAVLIAQVFVGQRSQVGRGTRIYPNVVLRENVSVGRNCVLHPGVVIGADGYGFFFAGGRHNKIPQVGTVIIEDDVEIGANSCIDRAMTGATVVGRGTKIDNLVQVAHNVRIGPLCLLAAQVGIAGSSTLGTGVAFGGQAGVADHINIADGARIGGQCGVIQDVEPKAELFGTPAVPIGESFKLHLFIRRLPELFKDIRRLKERIAKNG